MPLKNEEKFLRKTIDSVVNQSFKEWELICVDDNSSDSSAEILADYALRNSQIIHLSNPNSGVISALQCGYKSANGNFITRMDADDLMPVNKLKVLFSVLKDHGPGHVSTGKVKYFNALGDGFVNYEKWLNSLIDSQSHWQHVFKECVIASPNWLIYKTDFDKVGGFDSKVYPEDYDLVFRFYNHGLKVVSTSEVTHLWRDHENRASRVSELYKENTFVKLKIDFFLKTARNAQIPLTLWGAGKKGKSIAKLLVEKGVEFNWLTNNSNKIGREIYGVVLQSDSDQDGSFQWILAVSQPQELKKKTEELESKKQELGKDYFVFV